MRSSPYELTPAQRQAIEHPAGNLQLIACAGSGKTEIVARRVARLLDPDGPHRLQPQNIVAFTFTNKAASELRHRITARVRAELGDLSGMSELFVGTIHGFCLQLLQNHTSTYRKFDILNDVQQALFIDRFSRQSGLTESLTIKSKRLLRRFVDTDRYRQALNILREDDIDWSVLSDCSVAVKLGGYRKLLTTEGHFDYSSILEIAEQSLRENAELRAELGNRIAYVVVDEYQDVNPVQERIIAHLHSLGANLCVVGDDDQTIYQWRGSTVENILGFESRYPDVTQVRLQENFRSSDRIVKIASEFITRNLERLPKEMQPAASQPYEAGDISALEFGSPDDEADWIAKTCRDLHGKEFEDAAGRRGLSWSDMAILLRSVRRNGDPIVDALRRHDIPFVVKGTARLFRTPEVQALRLAYHYIVGIDIYSSKINCPAPDAIDVSDAWLNAELGIREPNLKRAIRYLGELRTAMSSRRRDARSIQAVLLRFLAELVLHEDIVPEGRRADVMANLGKFSQLISDYEAIHFHSDPQDLFEGFVNFLYHQADGLYQEGAEDSVYAVPDAVQVMTVHQAKGMQWPVLFLPALLRNRFPSAARGGSSVWDFIPAEAVANAQRYQGSRDDERRLFYVAMTRSQKFLHMTWAPIGDSGLYYLPSEFWTEMQASRWVQKTRPNYANRPSAPARPTSNVENVELSFSNLRHFLRCPYEFKLRVHYGFTEPYDIATGYGSGLHNALAEVHTRADTNQGYTAADIRELVERHLRLPFAGEQTRRDLKAAARQTITHYVQDRSDQFRHIQFVEKDVEVNLDNGIVVRGRIDLVEQRDTGETTIIDLKSSRRSQSEEISEQQLHTYSLGYRELTGRPPDFVEIYDLEGRSPQRRTIDHDFVEQLTTNVQRAADAIRSGRMVPDPSAQKCHECGVRGLCSEGRQAAEGETTQPQQVERSPDARGGERRAAPAPEALPVAAHPSTSEQPAAPPPQRQADQAAEGETTEPLPVERPPDARDTRLSAAPAPEARPAAAHCSTSEQPAAPLPRRRADQTDEAAPAQARPPAPSAQPGEPHAVHPPRLRDEPEEDAAAAPTRPAPDQSKAVEPSDEPPPTTSRRATPLQRLWRSLSRRSRRE